MIHAGMKPTRAGIHTLTEKSMAPTPRQQASWRTTSNWIRDGFPSTTDLNQIIYRSPVYTFLHWKFLGLQRWTWCWYRRSFAWIESPMDSRNYQAMIRALWTRFWIWENTDSVLYEERCILIRYISAPAYGHIGKVHAFCPEGTVRVVR